ncbi:SICAvar, type I [Plasmodium knowlesi strain H]|uniref:SICAvar, type I n=3 Tax=Plasmodium knowlesi TaxID=5850 RepID=A0A1A7VHN8_PLAKH|nr:SICAvar, type I [Plasmodium knowlesi strain H]OTN67099.1 SICAvar type I [Plasmodium knowlesi]CAA9988513.1 SICAvar, type I [Plasmodium knowlesi strain H]SBO21276.1 SICAvar, type I [Plasmodium knowlesi strain H]SBO21729.1 SICAvar, type I [Plasmodium knowlesi strain H]VVS77987.1 SICAvar, type I [Plasmodium knowlesi strain H]
MAGKFAGVLAEWYKSTGKNGDAYVKLEKEMKDTFEELGNYLKGASDPTGVAAACSRVPERYWVYTGRSQDKLLCKALLRVVYWMNGLDEWARSRSDGANEKELKEYLRCIIGHAAMIRLLSNKCQVVDIVQAVQKAQANVAGIIDKENLNKKCGWVTLEHMKFSSKFLGKTLVEWVNEQNRAQGWSSTYINWTMCPKKGTWDHGKIEEEKDKSKGILDLVKEKKARELHEKVYQQGSSTSPGSPASAVDPTSPVGPTSPHGSPTASEDILEQFLQNAESCKAEEKDNMQNCLRKKLDLTIGKPCGDSSSNFCSRVDCILKKKKEMNDSSTGKTVTENKVREEIKTEVTSFDSALSNNAARDNDIDTLCKDVKCTNDGNEEHCVRKETCKLIVKALKDIHQIKKEDGSRSDGDRENDRIFKSTIHCMALNALIHKLKKEAEEGGYGCAVEDGIEKAFKVADDNRSVWCKEKVKGSGNEKGSCESCGKDNQCVSTEVGGIKPRDVVLGMLNNDTTPNIQPTLEGLHSQATLCDRLHCAINQWKTTTTAAGTRTTTKAGTGQINDEEFWKEHGPMRTLWEELAEKMKATNGTGNGECDSFETEAEKWACKYLHAGFKQLYEGTSSAGAGNDGVLDNPSFRQTMGCFLLHAYANEMKRKATCNIEKGISTAFTTAGSGKGGTACNGGASGKGPCVPCQWQENILNTCTIKTNGSAPGAGPDSNVENKLKTIVNDQDSKIEEMLTKINERTSLCDHMKCIATHLSSSTGQQHSNTTADNFWKDDVKNLWKELVEEMRKNGTNGQAECNGFDNPSATVACNYLHVAFKKLKELSKSIKTDGTKYPILHKDPSFAQTMGCFLLHSYAKHMQKESICDIEKGIKQAFKAWEPNNTGNCTGNSPCIECKWEGKDYDTCQIKTNGGTGTTVQTAVKEKLEEIVHKDKDPNIKTMLNKINKMKTLCDGLKCIASHLNSTNTQTKQSASIFWTEGGEVGQLWEELSNAMKTNGGNNKSGNVCTEMDDGTTGTGGSRTATNPERKACNYLHAGLKALYNGPTTTATKSSSSTTPLLDNPLLRQTVGCLLLHAYAKQMQGKSQCVITSGLKKAFQNNNTSCTNDSSCIKCEWEDTDYDNCQITTNDKTEIAKTKVQDMVKGGTTLTTTMEEVNKTESLCDKFQCAASNWFKNHSNVNSGTTKNTSCNFWDGAVRTTLQAMFKHIDEKGKTETNAACNDFGDGNPDSVERKACNHITAGLEHINTLSGSGGNDNDQLLARAVGCIALNMYADKIINESKEKCPIHDTKIIEMFNEWNRINNYSCLDSGGSGNGNNNCFVCQRQWEDFKICELSVSNTLINTTSTNGTCSSNNTNRKEVQTELNNLFEDKNTIKMSETLSTINKMDDNFCTQLQCAAKQYHTKTLKKSGTEPVSWENIKSDATEELTALLKDMNDPTKQSAAEQYCSDKDAKWDALGHKKSKTNKAACLLFAAGLKHIYNQKKGQRNGPSFGQTMGCLFLKEYAKQLKKMAEEKRKGNSWVHPLCDIEDGINHAFEKSENIMKETSPCNKNVPNSCFVCTQNGSYDDCKIGNDKVGSKVNKLFKDPTKQTHMQQTLENTVCPILLTDLLTPFLPLAPVSIGLSAMAYYLWKYFGPLGKGGPRFRRSPAEIPGPSIQDHVLGHVDEGAAHEYRLVKERKPRSAPTRTKRSGRVNRRTIIEIHFEVLDECQKGDTQLNQKDFLELLVQEFMGSEFMEEEQVPKEEVLMEPVPMELVPNLGSGFMV